MGTTYRYFEAPPDGTDDLPISKSFWHLDRAAIIPLGHWQIIVEFAKSVDPQKGELLDEFSFGDYNNDGQLNIPRNILIQLIEFLEDLRLRLSTTTPITMFKDKICVTTRRDYDNEIYQSMLEAVISVYKESLKLDKPISAYNE